VVTRAIKYLRKAQHSDGGFGQMAVGDSNAQSTAFAIQGLVAAGRTPRQWKRTRTPIEYLKSLQAADGSVRYSRTSMQTPVWVTAQALNALEGKPFPLPPAPRKKARTVKAAAGAGSATSPSATSGSGAHAAGGASRAKAKRAKAAAKSKRAHRAKRATATQPGADDLVIRTLPTAQTTKTTDPASSQTGDGEGSIWPLAFAAVLGIVILVAIRLAWRRE
jgi:hypothetical protein